MGVPCCNFEIKCNYNCFDCSHAECVNDELSESRFKFEKAQYMYVNGGNITKKEVVKFYNHWYYEENKGKNVKRRNNCECYKRDI